MLTVQVRESFGHYGKVAFGNTVPFVAQVPAIFANHGEARRPQVLESRRADHGVHFVLDSVGIDDTVDCKGRCFCSHNRDIVFQERLEVTRAGSHTTTAECESWDEFLAKVRVMVETFAHKIRHKQTGLHLILTI